MPLGFKREPTTWRGVRAWRLAGARLWAVICPERGAKITSLFDAATGREWLVPAPLRPLRPLTYGALWSAYEMCGWDEVCPTLEECAFPGPGRAAGHRLPDHGEVWAMAWEDESGSALHDPAAVASVLGAALPYRLRRRAAVEDGDTLVLDYELANGGEDALPFQWAAHPLVTAGPAASISVGPGWVMIDDRGTWLRFEWDSADVPWFAFERGDAELSDRGAVVPMPSTGRERSLLASVEGGPGAVRSVAAGEVARWRRRATGGGG
jgi:hypothetical protein